MGYKLNCKPQRHKPKIFNIFWYFHSGVNQSMAWTSNANVGQSDAAIIVEEGLDETSKASVSNLWHNLAQLTASHKFKHVKPGLFGELAAKMFCVNWEFNCFLRAEKPTLS
jgi:hypothetical protein